MFASALTMVGAARWRVLLMRGHPGQKKPWYTDVTAGFGAGETLLVETPSPPGLRAEKAIARLLEAEAIASRSLGRC